MLTHHDFCQQLSYNPETGVFFRRIKLGKNTKLGVCGTLDSQGYVQVGVDGKHYRAHRLAWFWMTGDWPEHQIDHINGVRHDNRWSNLREACNAENMRNRGKTQINKTGFKGVSFNKSAGKFVAQITEDYKNTYLGIYTTAEGAARAYRNAAEKQHKEFAKW